MKSVEIVAHTTGGVIRSAVDQMTERMYEELKNSFKVPYGDREYLMFNTDNGCVVIPGPQVLYIELNIY